MKKIIIPVFILFLVAGCSSMQNYQLVSIDNEPYFIDNRTGNIYKINKRPDGSIDAGTKVGKLGL